MNRLSLKMKLGIGFGSLLVVLLAMGFVAYQAVDRLAEISTGVAHNLEKKDMVSQIEAGIEKQSTGVRGFLLAGKEDLLAHDNEGKQEFSENMSSIDKLLIYEHGRALFADIQRDSTQFRTSLDREIQLRRAGKNKEAIELMFSPETAEVRTRLRKETAALMSFQDELNEKAQKEQTAFEKSVRIRIWVLAVAGVLVGLIVTVLTTRSISVVLVRMLTLIQEIAANNLAADDMEITSQDEVGAAGTALNGMKHNLHQLVRSIADTAEQLAASSEELSATSQQITANSEETTAQAKVVSDAGGQVNTNLQTLATGAEEMNSTIGEIAQERDRGRAGGERSGHSRGIGESDGLAARRIECRNREGDRSDHFHRAADQSAGAECNHRSGARRRSGQGFRRGRQRSERTGEADGESDRRDQAEDHGDPEQHGRSGGGHRGDQGSDRQDQPYFDRHRDRS